VLLATERIAGSYTEATNHVTRRVGALNHWAGVLSEQQSSYLEIREYDVPPSVSAIMADDRITCLSWYRSWHDERTGAVALRGHTSAAIVSSNRDLLRFSREQFEALWRSGTPIILADVKQTPPRKAQGQPAVRYKIKKLADLTLYQVDIGGRDAWLLGEQILIGKRLSDDPRGAWVRLFHPDGDSFVDVPEKLLSLADG
jgi:hypothetical protein